MHPTGANTPCLTPQMGIQDAAATRCTPRYAPPETYPKPGSREWECPVPLRSVSNYEAVSAIHYLYL